MTSSLIIAAHLAREAVTCFLTHCAIEEDVTTFHAYHKARIADKALSEAFVSIPTEHQWMLQELNQAIDTKRMRMRIDQMANEIEGLKLQLQAKENEVQIAYSLALEEYRQAVDLACATAVGTEEK